MKNNTSKKILLLSLLGFQINILAGGPTAPATTAAAPAPAATTEAESTATTAAPAPAATTEAESTATATAATTATTTAAASAPATTAAAAPAADAKKDESKKDEKISLGGIDFAKESKENEIAGHASVGVIYAIENVEGLSVTAFFSIGATLKGKFFAEGSAGFAYAVAENAKLGLVGAFAADKTWSVLAQGHFDVSNATIVVMAGGNFSKRTFNGFKGSVSVLFQVVDKVVLGLGVSGKQVSSKFDVEALNKALEEATKDVKDEKAKIEAINAVIKNFGSNKTVDEKTLEVFKADVSKKAAEAKAEAEKKADAKKDDAKKAEAEKKDESKN